VHPKTLDEWTDTVGQMIDEQRKGIIANHNLHSLYLFHRSREFREFYRKAVWTYIDGMPIIALARLYGHRLSRSQRITNVDWIDPLMGAAARHGWRIYYLGSSPGVAEAGAAALRRRHSALQMRTRDGYFDVTRLCTDNLAVLADVNNYEPDILMVGMGMPRQELWIQENLEQVSAKVIFSVGAAIDYFAGTIPTPPRWAARVGLEWAYRLMAEPGRLWKRYLLEPWSILVILAMDLIRRGFRLRETSFPEE
jgi:N-acetylglucosaminyldiphosphoundecaprenol N-acetyl-beta-D-mannosaminyltransferase